MTRQGSTAVAARAAAHPRHDRQHRGRSGGTGGSVSATRQAVPRSRWQHGRQRDRDTTGGCVAAAAQWAVVQGGTTGSSSDVAVVAQQVGQVANTKYSFCI